MLNKSYIIIFAGLASMMVASAIFYFDIRHVLVYALFALGFILVGVGLLLGFAKMVSEKSD